MPEFVQSVGVAAPSNRRWTPVKGGRLPPYRYDQGHVGEDLVVKGEPGEPVRLPGWVIVIPSLVHSQLPVIHRRQLGI